MMNDKKVTQAFASALAREDKPGAVKVSSPSLYGISHFIPEDVSADDLCTRTKNCTKAERIRSTRTYKLHFESKEHLNEAIQSPLTLGYERLSISEYKFLPL